MQCEREVRRVTDGTSRTGSHRQARVLVDCHEQRRSMSRIMDAHNVLSSLKYVVFYIPVSVFSLLAYSTTRSAPSTVASTSNWALTRLTNSGDPTIASPPLLGGLPLRSPAHPALDQASCCSGSCCSSLKCCGGSSCVAPRRSCAPVLGSAAASLYCRPPPPALLGRCKSAAGVEHRMLVTSCGAVLATAPAAELKATMPFESLRAPSPSPTTRRSTCVTKTKGNLRRRSLMTARTDGKAATGRQGAGCRSWSHGCEADAAGLYTRGPAE